LHDGETKLRTLAGVCCASLLLAVVPVGMAQVPGLPGSPRMPSLPRGSDGGGIPGLDGLPFQIPGLGGSGVNARAEAEKPAEAPKPSDEALARIRLHLDRPLDLVSMGLRWLGDGAYPDAAEAFRSLRERHPSMAALALYNEGCVHYASGDRALAQQMFERALAQPEAETVHRLATFNLGQIRLDRVENRREMVLPGLDPIRNALQAGPERAWQAYSQAVGRSIQDLTIASAMFRAALFADPQDQDAMQNLRYARSQIVELRRERDRTLTAYEEFLTEVIMPAEVMQKVMDLTERQDNLATGTGSASRLRSAERADAMSTVMRDQRRVTAETEDLLRRLDAMARRGSELFGEDNPLMAGMLQQFLGTGADAIADAIGAQRWAEFELRGEEYAAAQDLQRQAAEDLRSIIEDMAAQMEDIMDLLEMFADQLEDFVDQVEQQAEGQEPEPLPPPQDMGGEDLQVPDGLGENAEELASEILMKEREDTQRRDEFMRQRRPRPTGGQDW